MGLRDYRDGGSEVQPPQVSAYASYDADRCNGRLGVSGASAGACLDTDDEDIHAEDGREDSRASLYSVANDGWTLPALVPDMDEHTYHRVLTPSNGWFNAGTARAISDGCLYRALMPFEGSKDTKLGLCVHAMIEAVIKDRPIRGYYPADGDPDPSRGEKMTKKEWQQAHDITQRLLNDPISRPYIEAATDSELTCLWEDDGVHCKSRIDLLCGLDIVDIKTTVSVKGNAFAKKADAMGYDLSVAHYLSAPFGFRRYIFLAVEKTGDHLVRLFEYDRESIEAATKEIMRLRKVFKHAYETEQWTRYPADVVSMRSWRLGKSEPVDMEESE